MDTGHIPERWRNSRLLIWHLGVMYAKGQGVKQDFLEAQKWFILAGSSGQNNRAEIRKGLTAAQEQEAETRAASREAGVR